MITTIVLLFVLFTTPFWAPVALYLVARFVALGWFSGKERALRKGGDTENNGV